MLASSPWLKQNEALSSEDLIILGNIRRRRNQKAYELPRFLGDADRELNLEHFQQIQRLLRRIEVWWIRNVDLPTNPDFDDTEVADEDVHPGPVLVLDYVIDIALGNVADKTTDAAPESGEDRNRAQEQG